MIYELLIQNIPHQKITQKFNDFLFETLNLKNAHLVHHQQEDNQKVLLMRLNNEKKFQVLQGMKLTYEEVELQFIAYNRTIIQKINNKLEERKKMFAEGKEDPENEAVSKIFLSNVPKYLKEQELLKIMKRFGCVKNVSIPKKSPGKPGEGTPKQKCRIAVVEFETFEQAVSVFFLDKIKIRDKKIKIKLYLHRQKNVNDPIIKMNQTPKKKLKILENLEIGDDANSRKSLEQEEQRWEMVKKQRNEIRVDSLIFRKEYLLNNHNSLLFNSFSSHNYSDGNGSFYYGQDPYLNLFRHRCGARQKNFLDSEHYQFFTSKWNEISSKVEEGEKCFRLRKGLKMARLDELHYSKNIRINFPYFTHFEGNVMGRFEQ